MSVKTTVAVLRSAPAEFELMDVELDDPLQGEIRVRMQAAGLCHSDDHIATGDLPAGIFPIVGGHEGAGIVDAVGPNTPGFEVGEHVIFAFLAACGRCRWCATGQQNLCDGGATTMTGSRPDGTFRFHGLDGSDIGQMAGLGTFAEHTVVSVYSAIKVPDGLPPTSLCLLGCAVGTGMGSAVNSARVGINDTVIILGIGGVGINAVQGAALSGASNVIAVDPVPFKREMAMKLGATHAFATASEARKLARSKTNGQGSDSTIVTIGIVEPEDLEGAVRSVRKGGTVVVTGQANPAKAHNVPLLELTMFQKRIQGSLFGETNANADVPRQIEMYRNGQLKLDELVTTTYRLDEIAQGYRDMHAGRNIRGVVVFE